MTEENTESDTTSDVTDCTDHNISSENDDMTFFDLTVRDGVCRLYRPDTRWLSTGYNGGVSRGDVAYLLSVPHGWTETAVSAYVAERCATAGFEYISTFTDGRGRSLTDTQTETPHNTTHAGTDDTIWMNTETRTYTPALLTGVDLQHARRARLDPVEVIVTAGVSNPATLPMSETINDNQSTENAMTDAEPDTNIDTSGELDDSQINKSDRDDFGTVNIILGTTRSLTPGALSNLVAVVSEAKAATLMTQTGFTGTTSDAVLIASDPTGNMKRFSGSATAVGNAARVCVRDALCAALASRYKSEPLPTSVEMASHGIVTDDRAFVSPVQISEETDTTTES